MRATICDFSNAFWLKIVALASLSVFPLSDANAVFTWFSSAPVRSLTLRVGSNTSAVDTVVFDVQNANLAPSPSATTGVPNTSTTLSPVIANGVDVVVRAAVRSTDTSRAIGLNLQVSSSAGLTCVSGSGCGSTIIPFNTISWIAYHHATSPYETYDIQNGTFNGSTQTLFIFSFSGASFQTAQALVFSYSNSTLYPAGQYKGRVTFTTAMP
ncbi:hypothetical protein [Thiolinea disciformis]|uniref:hypothetical protein n=1 Tax=Thiolinea disciformis TaxID=125614 RepID=UPI00037E7AEA|nr:hypothetical protein [Thiolinea disciformis]